MRQDTHLQPGRNALNHAKGQAGEEKACRFLEEQGFRILARNFRFHRTEIDIIAMEQETLCFIEVKYRSRDTFGFGYQAVDRRKQERIRRTAEAYLLKNGLSLQDTPCRFDIVSLDGEELKLYRNSF